MGFGSGIEHYFEDDYNIVQFPGTLSSYRNLTIIDAEEINNDGSAILTYHNEEKNLNFSLLLERPIRSIRSIIYYPPSADRMNTIMIGKNNSTVYFGANGGYSTNVEDSLNKYDYLYLSTGYGYSTKGTNPVDMAIHFLYVNEMEEQDDSSSSYFSRNKNRGYESRILFRTKHKLKSGLIRPFVELGFKYYETERTYQNMPFSDNSYRLSYYYMAELGIVHESWLNSNNCLWVGFVPLSFMRYSYELNDRGGIPYSRDWITKTLDSHLFIALESQVKGWLTTRIGIQSNYKYKNYKYSRNHVDQNNRNSFYSRYSACYGLSMNYRKFKLDATVYPGFAYNGPHFISGFSSRLFGNISISYQW